MLPRECFKYSTGETQVANESNERFIVESVEFSGPILLKIKDGMFPLKSYPSAETIWSINIIKSIIVDSLKIFIRWQFVLGLLIFFSNKALNEILVSFNRVSLKVISPYILKDKHLTFFSRELHFLLFTILFHSGIKEETADTTATILIHLIEYDNAYRYRLQDLFSETTKEQLQNPIKEIPRLIQINKERDFQVTEKIQKLGKLLTLILRIPKFNKAYQIALKDITLAKLSFQEDDIYWVCFKTDYKWLGMTNDERMEMAKERGWSYPKSVV